MNLYKLPLEERNAAYERLTKVKRASAIASDVLLQLKAEKYVAFPGVYAWFDDDALQQGERSLQKQAEEPTFKCDVCALGGAFMSAVRLSNQFEVDPRFTKQISLSSMYAHLERAFTEREIYAMEACFEASNASSFFHNSEMEGLRASSIGSRCFAEPDATKRLEMVMKHVIKNSGRFLVKGLALVPNNPNKE